MSGFYLHVLGDPVLKGPSGPVSGRAAHKRRLALLAILAAARGRPVGRERLLGLLWPEQPAESARHSLSESLYVLRKELAEDALVPAGSDVALNPEVVASDVAAFAAALEAGDDEGAVRAYGGPFLDGFYVAGAAEFERWAEEERGRLARAYAGALERLAEAAEAEGSVIGAVDWWRRLAAHDPFSARAALRLVRALDAAGERPAALRFAETHAALLREELGVEPSPEMAALVARLRAPAPPPPAVLAAPPAPPPAAPSRVPGAEAASSAAAETPAPAGGTDAEAHPPSVSAPPAPAAAHPSAEASPSAAPEAGASQSPAPPQIAGTTDGRPAPPSARGRPGWRTLTSAAAGVMAGLALATVSAGGVDVRPAGAAPQPAHPPERIAVLYFDDHTPGRRLEYLAHGLTEMLIHELGQVGALDVISRNGVKPYRGGTVPLDTLAARLRVGSVVEGSIQASADSVWVTVQLVDAATQGHLESRMLARPLADVVSLERDLAAEVSAILRRRLGREVHLRRQRAETESAEAYALVMQAALAREAAARLAAQRDALDRGSAARVLLRADSLLARARAADPRWVRPLVERGWTTAERARLAEGPRRAALDDSAAALAERALRRAPGDASALELRGRVSLVRAAAPGDTAGQGARWDAAERDLRAAVAAEPSRASAWGALSVLLRFRGRLAEADLAARRALDEDAYLAEADRILHNLYSSALALGDHREAGALCDRGRAQFPDDWRFVECRLTLMREDPAARPDPAAAWALVEALDRLDPPVRARAAGRPYSPVYRRVLAAAVLARAGERDSARAVLARARDEVGSDPVMRTSLLYDEAAVRLLLGERDAARRLLDALVAARPGLRDFIARDPLFKDLPAAGR